jgi:biopolymer transport protein ExbB/TolQ
MNVNDLAQKLGDSCYLLLTVNFLWGLYCVVLLYRRTGQLRFRRQRDQDEFLMQLMQRLQAKDFDGALYLCDGDSRALAQLSMAAISHRHMGQEQVREVVAELIQRDVLASLEHRLAWVATVIKAGPLLGLFGTVLGMMAAFGRIGEGVQIQPSMIAHDISIALVCTAMGLATAIPFSYLLANLNVRVRSVLDAVNSGMARVLDCFSGHTAAWRSQ